MDNASENSSNEHTPVLRETLAGLISLPTDAAVVDATLGHGGHSLLFGENLGPDGIIIGLDVDETCIKRAHIFLENLSCRVVLVRDNFAHIEQVLSQQGIEKVDLIIADLGFCSAQLNDPDRGLSFQQNMPLDMRLDSRLKTTAADLVNGMDEKALADLIYNFGQERASRRIARMIAELRTFGPIKTTAQLSTIVCKALRAPAKDRRNRIHPATKTFQALRIAVNNELENLKTLLEAAPALLRKNGFIAVISFHSLEDKIVKNNFRENKVKADYSIMTKKPLVASRTEIEQNPRARSAKLRIAQRI